MQEQIQSSLISVSDAGRILGVSDSTIWRMIRRGTLPSIRRGGRRLIPSDALDNQALSHKTSDIPPLRKDHPIFRLVGAGKSGGKGPGARDKHAILDR